MQFTTDWVSGREDNFKACMSAIDGKRDRFLEIGVFEGRSTCWLLQNGLDAEGLIYCIDPFYGVKGFDNENLKDRFHANVMEVIGEGQSMMVNPVTSYYGVPALILNGSDPFDFMYIDGSHTARDTLIDLCMTWKLLKRGGVMLIDDYEWSHAEPEQERPKLAIDCFMEVFKGKYEVLFKNYQVGLKKL